MKATDADSGQNAELEYEVSDDHFSIDAAGVVSNNKQLDADNNNAYYEFTVTAKNKKSNHSIPTVFYPENLFMYT